MVRTTRSQVTFDKSFRLAELDDPLPAGTYDIDTDEEVIEGNERTIYVRTATMIHVHRIGSTRTVTINPAQLAVALQKEADQD